MKTLVVNCGSSSLKCRLYDMADESVLASGNVERLGESGTSLTCSAGHESLQEPLDATKHDAALAALTARMFSLAFGVPNAPDDLEAVGHRVVHGGALFREATPIDAAVEAAIETLSPLAPVHNPLCLLGIRKARALFPAARHVAVFDTAFHHTLPEHAFLYALPYALYEDAGVRRYGFHGTSHRYATERATEFLAPGPSSRLITCHLGAGSSLAAIKDGRSIDTSMGMTPAEGLVMATRSGDVDPGLFAFLTRERGMSAEAVDTLLNRESGLLGVSGLTGDIRELEAAASAGNARAELALTLFAYRARKAIGAYLAALGGADAIVFTGGAGTHGAALRERIVAGLEGLGICLDAAANAAFADGENRISTADSPTALLVIPTNEELVIARDAAGRR